MKTDLLTPQNITVAVQAVRGLLRSNRAATMPEYAVLTLIVIAFALIGVEVAGHHSEGIYRQVSSSLAGTQTRHSGQSERRVDGFSLQSRKLDQRENLLRWSRLIFLVLLAVIATGAWLLLRRKSSGKARKPKALENIEEESNSQNVFEKRQQILRMLSNDSKALFDGALEVRHLMTRNPVTVKPNQTLQEASDLMQNHSVDHLLVCEENGTLAGLLSKFYLQRTNAKTIVQAMADEPLFVAPNTLLNPTVTQMINRGISCVAVVEQGRAVGILTTTDVQLTLQCALQLLFKSTTEDEDASAPQPV